MKDIELIAESVARDAATACAARMMRRAVEKHPDSPEKARTLARLTELESAHMLRAVSGIATHKADLEVLIAMPPINPS